MTTHATGNFDMTNWTEANYSETEGLAKLAKASVTNTYHGDIEGNGHIEFLLVYAGDQCTFTGIEQVVGRIGERQGSFVLQHNGVYEDGMAKCTWFVVESSGTGALQGLRGQGGYGATHTDPSLYTLDYEFAK